MNDKPTAELISPPHNFNGYYRVIFILNGNPNNTATYWIASPTEYQALSEARMRAETAAIAEFRMFHPERFN